MLTPKGNTSTKNSRMNMTWKRSMKLERIARLSLDPAGYSLEQIANHLGCHTQTVILIRQTPEYQAKMLELSTGVLASYTSQLHENVETARDEMRNMVPSALMVIRDSITGKYGNNLRFKAAQEVMDRNGELAKISKSSVTVEHKPNLVGDPSVVSNLMQLLNSAPSTTSANEVSAATGGFTVSAQVAGAQQITMSADNTERTLEQLDLSALKPN